LRFIDPEGLDVQVLNDEAKKLLLDTLPENIRKKVAAKIDKNGKIKQGSLNKIKSKDQNFLDLKTIVNDKRNTEVTTGTGFKNPGEDAQQFFYQDASKARQEFINSVIANGSSKEEAEKLAVELEKESPFGAVATFGVFQTPEQTGGNPRVTISDATGPASTMPLDERVGTTGHELYGHALMYLQGKTWGHEEGGKPYSYFTAIEDRSKANFRGPQKLANPQSIKPKK